MGNSAVVSAPQTVPPPAPVAAPEAEPRAEAKPAFDRSKVDKRVVGLVVHGIGEQAPGDVLETIVNEFLPLIRVRLDPQASISASPLDDDDPPEATIWFSHPDKQPTAEDPQNREVWELRFIECWWAKAFHPPTLIQFLGGLKSFIGNWWRRDGNPASTVTDKRYWDIAAYQRVISYAGYLALLPVAFLVLPVLWAINYVAPSTMVPEPVKKALRGIINFFLNSLGDMSVYINNPFDGSRIRTRFEERFKALLEEVTKDPSVQTVFVIAHSMGSAVSYEALTGRRMNQALEEAFSDGRKFVYISVGSALNSAWDIVPEGQKFRFYRDFSPCVTWLNFWSGPDPVARGTLRRRPPVNDPDWVRGGPGTFRDIEVVNQMDLFSDHSAYWNNAEEVLAPILGELTDASIKSHLPMRTKERKRRVRWLAGLKMGAWLTGIAVAVGVWVALALTSWEDEISTVSALVLPDNAWYTEYVVSPLAITLAAAVATAVAYATLVKWRWNAIDQGSKYKEPATVAAPGA